MSEKTFFLKERQRSPTYKCLAGAGGAGAACSASFRACHLHGFIRAACPAFNVRACWFETICMPSCSQPGSFLYVTLLHKAPCLTPCAYRFRNLNDLASSVCHLLSQCFPFALAQAWAVSHHSGPSKQSHMRQDNSETFLTTKIAVHLLKHAHLHFPPLWTVMNWEMKNII